MEILPLALFLVLIELTVGSFVSLFLLDLRGDTSRGFIIFQGALYLLFAALMLGAMNAFATPEIIRGFGLDERWIHAQGPLTLAFAVLMVPWNILLWSDRQPQGSKAKAAKLDARTTPSRLRLARFIIGGVTATLGVVALFVVGMGYRTLASSHLGGAFVVLTLLAGGMALGGVTTAMLLGHWYLNTPTASGKPLEFATTFLLIALAAELFFSLLTGPTTAHARLFAVAPTTPTATVTATASATSAADQQNARDIKTIQQQESGQAPLGTAAMVALEYVLGFIAPLALGGIALYLTRGRSFQSATGMLYLCVAFIFLGEVLGRGLLLLPTLG